VFIRLGLDQLRLDQLYQGRFCLCSPKADGESATLTSMMQQDNDTEPTGQTATSDRSDRPGPTGQIGESDRSDRSYVEWLQQRIEHYRDRANDMCETIDDLGDLHKLG